MYREAGRASLPFTGVPLQPRTLWGFEQEFAPFAEAVHRAMPPRMEHGVHAADTTFVRGLKAGSHHPVHVAVLQDPEDHHCEMVKL